MIRSFVSLVSVLTLLVSGRCAVAGTDLPDYEVEVVDVNTSNGIIIAAEINDSRQLVLTKEFRTSTFPPRVTRVPYAWNADVGLQRLVPPDGSERQGAVYDINEAGQFVGIFLGSAPNTSEPFIGDAATGATPLFSSPGIFAFPVVDLYINDSGAVAGTVATNLAGIGMFTGAPGRYGFLRMSDGNTVELPEFNKVTAINNRGDIVGWSYETASSRSRALLRQADGTLIDLGVLPGDFGSVATDMNKLGTVVGYSEHVTNLATAFLWSNGEMVALDPTGRFDSSQAWSINDHGAVVGRGSVRDPITGLNQNVCWIWRDGSLSILNELLEGLGTRNCYAIDVNNRGDIVVADFNRAFVLLRAAVIPEPSSLALLAASSILVAVIRLRRWSRAK